MLLTLEQIIFTAYIGVFITVWDELLTNEGQIFGWYRELLSKFPALISKPLGECMYCFGGQIAIWSFLLWEWNPVQHIQFIALTLFFITIINSIYLWIKHLNA